MANGTTIQARIDVDTKEKARAILHKLGFTMSDAIVIYIKQIIMQRGIPFDVKIPNETTVKTFEKTDAGRELHKVSGIDELAKELKS